MRSVINDFENIRLDASSYIWYGINKIIIYANRTGLIRKKDENEIKNKLIYRSAFSERHAAVNCRDRLDKKRKRELKKLRQQLAQQQQLQANQNLHQSSSRGTQSDDEGVQEENCFWKLFTKVGGGWGRDLEFNLLKKIINRENTIPKM